MRMLLIEMNVTFRTCAVLYYAKLEANQGSVVYDNTATTNVQTAFF